MTGQTLLDTMELLNQELQLQSGEADVTRGLLALNIAQDHFEASAAKRPNLFGSSDSTFTQTANQEYTTWPTGLLRLDGLQLLDSSTLRPVRDLTPRFQAGSHAPSNTFLAQLVTGTTTGKPVAFWENGNKIFWDPVPDAANVIRWYGLQAATDITASGTFLYPDICRLAFATFAVTLLKLGVDDDPGAVSSLSQNLFEGTIDTLASTNRAGARPLNYSYDHR
jgi:hypothetical protein